MRSILLTLLLCPLLTLGQDTIKVPTIVAKTIVRDLITYDSLKAVHKLTVSELALTRQKTYLQSGMIQAYEEKSVTYEQQIVNEQEKYKVQGRWLEDLRKENKNLKGELRIVKTVGVLIVGGLAYLLLTK